MGTNFGGGEGTGVSQPRASFEGKIVAACVVIVVAIVIWAAVTTVQADAAHGDVMRQLQTEYEQLAGDLNRTQSIAAPETGDVSAAYEQATQQAAAVTAFQQTGEGVDAARVAFADPALLTGERWYPGAMDGVTWEFSLAYRIADGGYPCGWFAYDADGQLLAYALSSFDGAQFTSLDVYLTAAGRDASAEATVDPVDIIDDAPDIETTDPDPVDIIDDAPDATDKDEQQRELEERDSMQSGITANPPDDEE